tara:strand:+ start:3378 stop:3689 length:312 start_codon:yes stop_codon:yes gene_type:complete
MVLDGLYMSLIGLAVVFMVLVFLLITINLLNYFDKKPSKKIIEVETAETLNKSESNIENVVAAIALSLAMSEKAPQMNISNKNSGSSNWLSIGQQRLFRSREV